MANSRFNLNRQNSYNHQYGSSYIEKYLKKEIDFLLAPSADQLNEVNFNDIYIPIPSAEKFLSNALNYSFSDKVLYLTGLTGSGKSMVLKKVFKLFGISPRIENNTLIIPFSFDNFFDSSINTDDAKKGIETVYINMLNSACELIEKTYENLKLVNDNLSDFLDLLKKCNAIYSQVPDLWPRPSDEERVAYFIKTSPIPSFTAMLKFYLNQSECPIDNVVIIVDDIEGVGEYQELIPITVAYRIITCLENTTKAKNWSLHLIISCRNYVYRYVTGNNFTVERQRIEAYTEAENFHIEEAPLISAIINRRYNAITKKDKSDKWVIALDVVMYILLKIDSSLGELILNLKIRNMRKALALLKRIVYNKQWIQRDYVEDTPGAFVIDSINNYNLSLPTLIRAIGMGETLIYDSNNSDIPNIIYNEGERDLYPLLIIKYCLKFNGNNQYSTWNNTIDLNVFYNKIENLFKDDKKFYGDMFKKSTEYLILNRLLLRSIDQLQDNTIPVNEDNVSQITNIYISNAAIDLWELFEKNSVLLEMYMDDIWIDNTMRATVKKKFRGFDVDNFKVALSYLKLLIDKEMQIRNHIHNLGKHKEYIELFGDDWVCQHLIKGLENSLKAFYKEDAPEKDLMYELNALKEKLTNRT